MQVDFLIIGQGLAGSLLAKELLRRGRTVRVVDDGWRSAASQVAAGLMTPLTGRRFSLTKDYSTLFERAREHLTPLGVFHPLDVYRLFVDAEQRARGLKRTECASCRPFIARITESKGELDPELTDGFGGALMHGAWVDLPKLLADVRRELQAAGCLIEATFEPSEATSAAAGLSWRHNLYGAIVYCDGYKSALRGPFTYLPWQPAKGEVLTLSSDAPQKPYVLNREGWALPLGDGRWRTGTNWQWDQLDETPSQAQQDKLLARFRGYFTSLVQVDVMDHSAGVRPCTADNRPFLGTHPSEPHTHIFNGLGPRGTVWAPSLTTQMADYLIEGKALPEELSINRHPPAASGA